MQRQISLFEFIIYKRIYLVRESNGQRENTRLQISQVNFEPALILCTKPCQQGVLAR